MVIFKNVIDEFIARGVIIVKQKTVYVRRYVRFRFAKLENVRDHWRSLPRNKRAF